jgi:hypothetical protein
MMNHVESKYYNKKKVQQEAKDHVKSNSARGARGSKGKQHFSPPGAINNFMKQIMAMLNKFQYFQKSQKKAASKKRNISDDTNSDFYSSYVQSTYKHDVLA